MCFFMEVNKMYIGTIVEDTIENKSSCLQNEHGLSLYIKHNNKNILFDAGPSDVLINNSQKMNLDLSEIDYLIISHGHFDHGGGIIPFLENNKKAKVYIQRHCDKNYYFEEDPGKEYIGLDPTVFQKYSDRLVFTDNSIFNITDDIFLVPNVELKREITYNNKAMLIQENNSDFKQDTFEHEQALIIRSNESYYLFSGCSHKGIINIIDSIKQLLNITKINFLIGGLHLVDDPIKKTSIHECELDDVSSYLKNNVDFTYTCHCTGDPAYNYLKKQLGNNIQYLRTGREINI